jgi:hypothetical protein
VRQTQSRKQVDRAGTATNLLSVGLAPVTPVRTHPLNAGRVQGAREHAIGEFDAPEASRATESCKQ